MVTGFDIWGHDPGLRRHWMGRIAAFILDAAVAFIPTSAVLYLMDVTDPLVLGLVNSVVFYLASSVPESIYGATLGKRIFKYRVHPVKGESLAGRACLRNITRALWFVLPPIDFALGMATGGDPRERLLDRVAGTRVVHSGEAELYHEALKAVSEENAKHKPLGKEVCMQCGGALMRLADEKLQCEKCGVIQ